MAPSSVAAYLASLPADRRAALEAVREVIRKHLPRGFEEGITFGMIGYYIPLSRYPTTYNGQPLGLASLASQKHHLALYLMCVYGDQSSNRQFVDDYRRSGKKLDMGKACVRFKKLDDLPLAVIGRAIARTSVDGLIARYEASRALTAAGKRAAAGKVGASKPAASKPAARRAVARRAVARRAVATTKPAASKPAARRAVAAKPAATKPAAAKPAARRAVATSKSAAAKPAARRAVARRAVATSKPATSKPARRAVAAKPAATKPAATRT